MSLLAYAAPSPGNASKPPNTNIERCVLKNAALCAARDRGNEVPLILRVELGVQRPQVPAVAEDSEAGARACVQDEKVVRVVKDNSMLGARCRPLASRLELHRCPHRHPARIEPPAVDEPDRCVPELPFRSLAPTHEGHFPRACHGMPETASGHAIIDTALFTSTLIHPKLREFNA
eukprot:1888356-Rhodomonas_salina.3